MDEMKVILGFSCGHRGKHIQGQEGLLNWDWDRDKERRGPKELGVVWSSPPQVLFNVACVAFQAISMIENRRSRLKTVFGFTVP